MNGKPQATSATSQKPSASTCEDCGAPLVFETTDSEFGRLFQHLVVLCDDCTAKRDSQQLVEHNRQVLANRFETAVARGLVAPETREARWAVSAPAIEAENAVAWQSGRLWSFPESDNLFVYGTPGAGKTFLCRCILRKAFVQGRDIAEVSGRRLLKVGARFDEGAGAFEAWKRADVLLLDDIDKTHPSRDGIDCLWELLDSRNSKNKRTLVTSNHKIGDLYAHLAAAGDTVTAMAAMDRLKPVTKLEMTGGSKR